MARFYNNGCHWPLVNSHIVVSQSDSNALEQRVVISHSSLVIVHGASEIYRQLTRWPGFIIMGVHWSLGNSHTVVSQSDSNAIEQRAVIGHLPLIIIH